MNNESYFTFSQQLNWDEILKDKEIKTQKFINYNKFLHFSEFFLTDTTTSAVSFENKYFTQRWKY